MSLQPFAAPGQVASGGLSPAAMGTPIATMSPLAATGLVTAPAQSLSVFLATAGQTATLTALGTYVHTAGVTAGAGVNRLAIYTAAGVLLAQTADLTAAFGAAALAEAALTTPVGVQAGTNYYLAILANFTGTAVQTIGVAGQALNSAGTPLFGGVLPNLFSGGQASMPASFTPSGLSVGGSLAYIYGRP